jgi:hypothetical protein
MRQLAAFALFLMMVSTWSCVVGQQSRTSRAPNKTINFAAGEITKLKESTGRGDRTAVVKLVEYPFRVNGKKHLTFRDEVSLLKDYDKVFTPQVLDRIRKAEPAAVFCRDGLGMLGDGVVWARASKGMAKVEVINRESAG